MEVDFNAVELGKPALGEAPEGFDAVDVGAALCEGFLLVDAHMLVIADIHQAIVSRPAIGTDDALRIDPSTDNGPQCVLGTVLDDLGVNLSLPLEDAEYRLFEGAPASQPGQRASTDTTGAKVAFIDFHHPSKLPAQGHSPQSNQEPQTLIVGIDGLAVEPQ